MKGKKIVVTVLAVWAGLFLLSASSAWAEPCEADLNCDGEVNQLDRKYFNKAYKAERGITNCDTCCPCPCGMTECGGMCVNTDTDESNCGSCGNVCLSEEMCVAGSCEIKCESSYPAPVPKTGQITCYEYNGEEWIVVDCEGTGQDGEHRKGVEWPVPRFTDNENGTVTDNLTGLMWTKDANLAGGGFVNFQAAIDYVTSMDSGTYTDWRVPNMREIFSLVDCSMSSPPLPANPFVNIKYKSNHLWLYWTSTPYQGNLSHVWCLDLYGGGSLKYCNQGGGTATQFLWPVRGGQ